MMIPTNLFSDKDFLKRCEHTVRGVVNTLLLSRSIKHLPIDKEDLYQIGWAALISCIAFYKEDKGVKFETYSSKVISNAVRRELGRQLKGRMVNRVVEQETDNPFSEAVEFVNWLINELESDNILTQREKQIFYLRFFEDHTFESVGDEMSISREWARRIYNGSLKKIKEAYCNERG